MACEVATIHMRTAAKNLVTTARTSHLPEQMETVHLISTLRKKSCAGNVHDLAHIPTQNCLAEESLKADNLITAVKTRRFLNVDIHPNLTTLMEHKAFSYQPVAEHFCTRENDAFFLSTLKVSLAPDLREGPFHVMFARHQHCDERNNNMCVFESQDASKNACICRLTC